MFNVDLMMKEHYNLIMLQAMDMLKNVNIKGTVLVVVFIVNTHLIPNLPRIHFKYSVLIVIG